MSKKKVCKDCKLFYEGEKCPNCGSNKTAAGWQGRINIIDAKKSDIASNMGIEKNGEYAIKVR